MIQENTLIVREIRKWMLKSTCRNLITNQIWYCFTVLYNLSLQHVLSQVLQLHVAFNIITIITAGVTTLVSLLQLLLY